VLNVESQAHVLHAYINNDYVGKHKNTALVQFIEAPTMNSMKKKIFNNYQLHDL
jgi:hypothetical protein